MYICIYVYLYTYTNTYVYIYVCMKMRCVDVYTYMYICMYEFSRYVTVLRYEVHHIVASLKGVCGHSLHILHMSYNHYKARDMSPM